MSRSNRIELSKFLKDAWAPPPRLTSWQWCEANLMIPPNGQPRPGRYSTNLTPYVRGVFNAFDDPKTEEIILCFGTQTAKTMTMMALMAYVMGCAPASLIWMMPSADLAQSFVETRFMPLVEATPILKKKLPKNRHKNKILEKQLADMTLNFVGGNSPANLASRSAAIIMGDEVDKLERSLGKEACPMELLRERQKWFRGRRKTVWASTPTTEDWKIWPRLVRGTHEKLFWPCPHCDHMFVPTWAMVKWSRDETMTTEQRASTAYIECPECADKFLEKHKRKALQKAEWRATNEQCSSKRVRSFHISEIQSPLSSLADMVIYFIEAKDQAKKGDVGKLQNFVNSRLCEPWRDGGYSKRDKEPLTMLQDGRPRGMVPRGAIGLVAGADTQDNGFYYTVRAWGNNGESWLVQAGFTETFESLGEVLWGKPWLNADGIEHRIQLTLQDSGGHRMDDVNRWCAQYEGRIYPCLGATSRQNNPFVIKAIEQEKFGSQQRVKVDTIFFKDTISQKLKIQSGDPGAFNFHAETPDDYFEQLTAEFRDPVRGLWVCPKHSPNHLWDAEVYAYCAAYMCGLTNRNEVEDEPEERRDEKENNDRKRPSLW